MKQNNHKDLSWPSFALALLALAISAFTQESFAGSLGDSFSLHVENSIKCADWDLWGNSAPLIDDNVLVRHFRGGKSGSIDAVSGTLMADGTRESFMQRFSKTDDLLLAQRNVVSVSCEYSLSAGDVEIFKINKQVRMSYADGSEKIKRLTLPFVKVCDPSGCFLSNQVDTQLLQALFEVSEARGQLDDLPGRQAGKEAGAELRGKVRLYENGGRIYELPASFYPSRAGIALPKILSKETAPSEGNQFRLQYSYGQTPRLVSDSIFWKAIPIGDPANIVGLVLENISGTSRSGIAAIMVSAGGVVPVQFIGFKCANESCVYSASDSGNEWKILSQFLIDK